MAQPKRAHTVFTEKLSLISSTCDWQLTFTSIFNSKGPNVLCWILWTLAHLCAETHTQRLTYIKPLKNGKYKLQENTYMVPIKQLCEEGNLS